MLSFRRALAVMLGAALPLFAVPAPPALAAVAERPSATATFNGAVNVVVYRGATIYVGGSFTRATDRGGKTYRRLHLAAISARTGRLLPWRPSANGAVHSLAVTPKHVYVGGDFDRVNGRLHRRLAKVGRAGAGRVLRTVPGFAANRTVFALTVRGGRLYAGGAFTRVGRHRRSKLAAFTLRRGQLVRGWTPSVNGGVRTLRSTRTRIYVGGGFKALDGRRTAGRLAAVRPTNGRLIAAFNPRITSTVYDVRVAGRTVYAAGAGTGGHVWALGGNGRSRWTKQLDGDARSLAVLPGRIYVGGHFTRVCATQRVSPVNGDCADPGSRTRRKLAAFGSGGGLTAWSPQATSRDGVFAVASNASLRKLAVGGMFSGFQNPDVARPHFAQFSTPR